MNLAKATVQEHAHVWTDQPEQRVHLVLKSGRHSNGYINADPLSVDTGATWLLASLLVQEYIATCIEAIADGWEPSDRPTVVITPPWGSFRLADYFAIQLQMMAGHPVDVAMVEKSDEGLFFIDREGHREALSGAEVVVIEDVSTTGKSTRQVCALAESYGAKVTAVGSVWNRGGVSLKDLMLDEDEVLLFSLIDEQLEDWAANQCPLCADAVPIATDLGHGTKFQAVHPDYPGGFTTLR